MPQIWETWSTIEYLNYNEPKKHYLVKTFYDCKNPNVMDIYTYLQYEGSGTPHVKPK